MSWMPHQMKARGKSWGQIAQALDCDNREQARRAAADKRMPRTNPVASAGQRRRFLAPAHVRIAERIAARKARR